MKFIVVQAVCGDGAKRPAIVNVESIRFVMKCDESDAKAVIGFIGGNPDATMYVVEDWEVLRSRLSDLELPMPGSV